MKTGKFLGDRYFFDDSESGLYFDLYPLKRGAGDELMFNIKIDNTNEYLESTNPAWKTCLLLLDSQIGNMSELWRQAFSAKTVLMTFRPGVEVADYSVEPWASYFNDGFLWSSANKVYTKYDDNNLASRFRRVEKAEVDAFLDTGVVPPPPPSGDDDDIPGEPAIGFPKEFVFTLSGKITPVW